MASPIGMIAPTAEIAERAQRVARDLEMSDQISFHVANLQEGVQVARELECNGVEVLIARRGTAELIRKNLATPLVPVPVSVQDMARALREAKLLTGRERPRIAFFALPSAQADLEVFREFMEIDLHIYNMVAEEEYLEWMVDRAIADKMQVIVAGSVATMLANQRNFPSVLLDSGPLALRTALVDARQVAYARMLEKIQAERFRTVVTSSREGILMLDKDMRVLEANPAALGILGRKRIEPGVPASAIFPGLDMEASFSENGGRNLTLPTDKGSLLLSAVPTRVGREVRGAVLFFQPTESITALGADIRKKLHSRAFSSQYDFDSIVGVSPQIEEARSRARLYAGSPGNILLIGETGTGKELFAHAVHKASPWAQGPFVAVNCAALPSSLLESELFGYEEGAFTGAARKGKPGMFELAHRGSIFLDEVSELDNSSQLRLLRVLQERCAMRLGGNRLIPIEVRVIAASNKNLWELVERRAFRDDLFFRLNVLPLFLPPLRAREGDVAVLARHFLEEISRRRGLALRLSQSALKRLNRHPWPGNVRELGNVMERISLAAGTRPADAELVESVLAPERAWQGLNRNEAPQALPLTGLADGLSDGSERERILEALRRSSGRRGRAAVLLGINRSTLYRKMRQYGISG